jgi:hypothetical protein
LSPLCLAVPYWFGRSENRATIWMKDVLHHSALLPMSYRRSYRCRTPGSGVIASLRRAEGLAIGGMWLEKRPCHFFDLHPELEQMNRHGFDSG